MDLKARQLPLLLLDIDGALSPYSIPPGSDADWATESIFGFKLPLRKELPGWLEDLAKLFSFAWCTTWERDGVEELAAHLGTPDAPYIDVNGHSTLKPLAREFVDCASPTAKLPYVKAWIRLNDLDEMPVAWVDDRLQNDAVEWARQRETATLLVHTNKDRGITDSDVRDLQAFADSVAVNQ